MGSSPHGGRIAFEAASFGQHNPHSTHLAKSLFAENLEHLADEISRVHVAWRSPTPASQFLTHRTHTTTDQPLLIWESDPFHVTMDADGLPYPVRIDAAGSATQANPVTFRVVIAPPGRAIHYAYTPTSEQVADCTTSVTTDGWLTHSDTIVQLSAEDALAGLTRLATLDAFGGDSTGVDLVRATISVWALTSNISTALRLTGVYAAEYVGP
jgi:hypothetical protein